MMTGRYLPGHEVYDNTVFKWHKSLDPAIPTVGSALRDGGYRSSYIGKWHLTGGPTPPMDLYGYADWDGNDQHFMGWAGTGVHFDPVIADSAARWLDVNGGQADPWFLTVALVNPHDVMWFPMDQPGYQADHPEELEATEALLAAAQWKDGEAVPAFTEDYDDVVDHLPENFEDDLLTKPACHRQWRWDQQHWLAGTIDPTDRESWRRQLDYYVRLHQLADESLGKVLAALERSGAWDDTVVIFTSDHGDMCGSHGLRSKGPFVYDEIMQVPCYVKPAAGAPVAAGSRSESLSSHVDLARTICSFAGVDADPGFQGVDLNPLARRPRGDRARPRPVRPRHRAHVQHPRHPLGDPRHLRRPPQVRALLRRGRRAPERRLHRRAHAHALRPRRRVRGPGARVVRPAGGSARAGEPGHGQRPPLRAPLALRRPPRRRGQGARRPQLR